MLQHGELGMRRRAGGGAQDRHVLAPALARPRPRRSPALGAPGPAACRPAAPRRPAGVGVFPHAAIVVEDDPGERRMLVAQLEQLVDLLLILGDGDGRPAWPGDRRPRRPARPRRCRAHGADRLGGELGPDPVRPVAADQAATSPRRKPSALRPSAIGPHPVAAIRPGVGVPDAEILLAHRHRRRASWPRCAAGAWEACRARPRGALSAPCWPSPSIPDPGHACVAERTRSRKPPMRKRRPQLRISSSRKRAVSRRKTSLCAPPPLSGGMQLIMLLASK